MSHFTNPLATPTQLYQSTYASALPQDLRESVFVATQCLTQAAGLLLELPQSVTAQAGVILARYWLVDSPMDHEFGVGLRATPLQAPQTIPFDAPWAAHDFGSLTGGALQDVSAASLYLVSKMGPLPRSPRDISNVYAYLLSRDSMLFRSGMATAQDGQSHYQTEADYFAFQKRLLALESRILYALSFNTRVSLPHPLAVTYLQTLDFLSQPKPAVALRTMQYLNTALLSPQMLYLTHQPHALATAAIYNAARDLGAKMPACAWWEVFDVDREELGFLVVGMRSLEGWVRKRKEQLPPFTEGMLTRAMMEEEMRARAGKAADDDGAAHKEDAGMRMVDSR